MIPMRCFWQPDNVKWNKESLSELSHWFHLVEETRLNAALPLHIYYTLWILTKRYCMCARMFTQHMNLARNCQSKASGEWQHSQHYVLDFCWKYHWTNGIEIIEKARRLCLLDLFGSFQTIKTNPHENWTKPNRKIGLVIYWALSGDWKQEGKKINVKPIRVKQETNQEMDS